MFKNQDFYTPRGVAQYPWLTTPDTKFNPDGHYKVKLLIDPTSNPEVDKFIASWNAFTERAKQEVLEDLQEKLKAASTGVKVKKLKGIIANIDDEFKNPLEEELDMEGEPTGKYTLDCRSNASGKTKNGETYSLKPRGFDAKGELMNDPPNIGGGSEIKLQINARPYFMESNGACGVAKPRIKNYQLLKLVEPGGSSGFGEEEGFVYEQKVMPQFDPLEGIGDDDDEEDAY